MSIFPPDGFCLRCRRRDLAVMVTVPWVNFAVCLTCAAYLAEGADTQPWKQGDDDTAA